MELVFLTAALLKVSVSCATSTSQMKPRFWLLMPKSTTLCVRKGSISCIPLPAAACQHQRRQHAAQDCFRFLHAVSFPIVLSL